MLESWNQLEQVQSEQFAKNLVRACLIAAAAEVKRELSGSRSIFGRIERKTRLMLWFKLTRSEWVWLSFPQIYGKGKDINWRIGIYNSVEVSEKNVYSI